MIGRAVVGAFLGMVALPGVIGAMLLIISGAYLVAKAFGPVNFPERLDIEGVQQSLAVLAYIGAIIGALIGAAWGK